MATALDKLRLRRSASIGMRTQRSRCASITSRARPRLSRPNTRKHLIGVSHVGKATFDCAREQVQVIFTVGFEKRARARPTHDLHIVPVIAASRA